MIENMSYYCCPQCGNRDDVFGHGGAKQAAEGLNVPFLGELPLNISIRLAGDEGRPRTLFDDASSPVAQACEAVVGRLVEEVESHGRARTPLPQLKIT